MELKKFACKCGYKLEAKPDGTYFCSQCNTVWKKETVEEVLLKNTNKLLSLFDEALLEQKEECIANIRNKLWNAVHEKYITRSSIRNYADELLTHIPDDFYAMFVKLALSGNKAETVRFLNEATKEDADIFLDEIVYFICKTSDIGDVVKATKKLVQRFGKLDDDKTEEFIEKLDDALYEIKYKVRNVDISRDVFVSYSDVERERVEELVEYLEKKGLKCFVAYRNLPNDTTNFWDNIETAITNSKIFLLVSSPLSRNNDNVLKELGKYFMLSTKLSPDKKLCRVEYLLGKYPDRKADYEPGDETVYRYFSEEGYTYFTVGQERELANYLYDIKVNGYLAVKQQKKPDEGAFTSARGGAFEGRGHSAGGKKDLPLSERVRILCALGNFDEAKKICDQALNEDMTDMNIYMGYIRIASNDYSEYENREIDLRISTAMKISRSLNLGEFDPDFAEYDKKRKKYFADKEAAERRAKSEKIAAEAAAAADAALDKINNKTGIGQYSVGNTVKFGRYPQSNAYTNEPIEWTVLKNENGKVMLLANKILNAHRFDRSRNNYANSEIRKWLNNDFYNKAFNREEKAKILTTTVDNSLASTCDSSNSYVCADTQDKVFLLSTKEAKTLIKSDEDRKRAPTPYAKQNGAYKSEWSGCGWWWLRSPSYESSSRARYVNNIGDISWDIISDTRRGVVPALVIEL